MQKVSKSKAERDYHETDKDTEKAERDSDIMELETQSILSASALQPLDVKSRADAEITSDYDDDLSSVDRDSERQERGKSVRFEDDGVSICVV